MRISCGRSSYEWVEEWATPPVDEFKGVGWAHHDLAITRDQRIIGFQSGGDLVCFFDRTGRLLNSWPTGVVQAHGMTVSTLQGQERLWIADPGLKRIPNDHGAYILYAPVDHGRVAEFDLEGNHLRDLPKPELAPYFSGRYAPTAVAVDDWSGTIAGRSHNGCSIWVADGYGQNLVHRFSTDGRLELTLTGEEGAGRFSCPHSLVIDHREPQPRLYITDRGNRRLQVYDLDGRFLRTVSEGLRSPSALATFEEEMFVAELHCRLTVLDRNDVVLGYIGRNDRAPERDSWPNAISDDGRIVRPGDLCAGQFNSPHSLTVSADGDIYVAEWIVGGRLTRLRRV